jgi:hypothetical protein
VFSDFNFNHRRRRIEVGSYEFRKLWAPITHDIIQISSWHNY